MARADQSHTDVYDLTEPEPALLSSTAARDVLARRLADIVCLPASRISPQERAMTADVLLNLLRDGDATLKAKVSQRLAMQAEAPQPLVRKLALDEFDIARPILERGAALGDFDMMEVVRRASNRHRLVIAQRNCVSETVAAAIVQTADRDVIEVLLRNPGARLASATMESLIELAADIPSIAALVVRRAELRPGQAFRLFWDARTEERKHILDRFAVGRSILQEAAADVFPMLERETRGDPATLKALGYIERRQRDRKADETSSYGRIEDIVQAASKRGFTEALRAEAARIARVSPPLLHKILGDPGGEALAVFAKAIGLERARLETLASVALPSEHPVARDHFRRTFDSLSTDKAQTVLRYWDWLGPSVLAE